MNALSVLRRTDQSARQWLAAIVLLSVLCAHALGFMHGIAHAFHADTAQSAPSGFAPQDAHGADTAPESGWLQALFASHDDAGDCRLFDAQGQQHGPVLCLPALSHAQAPCTNLQQRLAGACVARWATLFDARAPPAFH
ncbi:hypothetical protein [Acidovorax sp.]|uniref:hypothetical protein n=1 Tax=Acidovorax sp. TaxID=1872122 RepID=UPI002637D353|nr:hypothetical protein [Acidovorax sp.]